MSGLGSGTWDINFPDPPAGCGEGPCWQTVMVNGKCYDLWKVNYILFGRMSSLCDFWEIKMEGVLAAQSSSGSHSLMAIGKTNIQAMFVVSCV